MPSPSLLQRLKERKLVQWALAYLAGAWVIYEAVDTIGDRWGLPDVFFRGLAVLLAIGFFVALVIAWYHGEKGRQRASGPELLMVAALLVVAGVALSVIRRGERSTSTRQVSASLSSEDERPSLAVLPLDNMSPDPEFAFFADGMHEELTTRISQISGMTVISRSSVEQYRDRATRPSIREIATALGGIDYLLEGSARISGGMVRIAVQLIDGRTDRHIWSDTFDRPYSVDESIELQTEIAREIANRLQVEITPEENTRISTMPTENQEAYDLYLQAMAYRFRPGSGEEDWSHTQALLEQAVGLDPSFALALARLSQVHGRMYRMGWDRTPDRLAAQKAAADSALALQPDLSFAQFAAGYLHYVTGEFQQALEHYYAALEGSPNDAEIVGNVGHAQRRLGNWPEVFAAYERVLALAPGVAGYFFEGAVAYSLNHRYREAIAALDRALTLAPDYANAAWYKGVAYWCVEGQLDTLRTLVETTPGMSNSRRVSLRLYERDGEGALALVEPGPDSLLFGQLSIRTKSLLSGWAHQVRGDVVAASAAFDSARGLLEAYARENPDDFRVHHGLGFSYAGLGRTADAARSVEQLTTATEGDVFSTIEISLSVARILSTAGLADEAIARIEPQMVEPSELCVNRLRTDWRFDPIRNDPRFQALLEEYADDVEH